MYVMNVEPVGETEVFHYKCANRECSNYGYIDNTKLEDEKEEEARQNYINEKLAELRRPQQEIAK
jgi:hypothetical protein